MVPRALLYLCWYIENTCQNRWWCRSMSGKDILLTSSEIEMPSSCFLCWFFSLRIPKNLPIGAVDLMIISGWCFAWPTILFFITVFFPFEKLATKILNGILHSKSCTRYAARQPMFLWISSLDFTVIRPLRSVRMSVIPWLCGGSTMRRFERVLANVRPTWDVNSSSNEHDKDGWFWPPCLRRIGVVEPSTSSTNRLWDRSFWEIDHRNHN